MTTLLLAWINSAYKCDYEFLFIATFLLDMQILAYILG